MRSENVHQPPSRGTWYDIDCPLCNHRSCNYCEEKKPSGRIGVFRHFGPLTDFFCEQVGAWIQDFGHYKNGFLPEPGGIYDQEDSYVRVINVLLSVEGRVTSENIRAQNEMIKEQQKKMNAAKPRNSRR